MCYRKFIYLFYFLLLFSTGSVFSQSKDIFKGKIIDFLISMPLEDTYIHNLTTGATVFTNNKGDFSIGVKGHDTIAITRVGYNPEFLILNDSLLNVKERVYVRLLMKSIMLREVKIYALKPYPLFIKDIAKKEENILEIKDVTLDEDEKKRIANENTTAGNVLAGTPLAHPFTFLYDQYSRKARLNRQYANLLEHEDELTELSQKYNPEIVERITKLKGNQLEEFMVYCSFTYYTLIVSSKQDIEAMIFSKFQQYLKENEGKQ
ncbi:MAG: hypothetical protein RBS13_00190 [Bacteroidales bacterium]|jgi:hypothetical protein|nr:hypothetical protein [Bacteroidales bacterium]